MGIDRAVHAAVRGAVGSCRAPVLVARSARGLAAVTEHAAYVRHGAAAADRHRQGYGEARRGTNGERTEHRTGMWKAALGAITKTAHP